MARARRESKFEVFGQEMVEKVVAKSGSSGRVYLPPDWIGKRVKVIRVESGASYAGAFRAVGFRRVRALRERSGPSESARDGPDCGRRQRQPLVRVPRMWPRGPPDLLRHGVGARPVRAGEERHLGAGTRVREERSRVDPDSPDPDRSVGRHQALGSPACTYRDGHRGSVGRGRADADRIPGLVPGILGCDRGTAVQCVPHLHARPRGHQPREPELRRHAAPGEAVRRVARLRRPRAGGGHGRLHARRGTGGRGFEDPRLARLLWRPLCVVVLSASLPRLGWKSGLEGAKRNPRRPLGCREGVARHWLHGGLRDGPPAPRIRTRAGPHAPLDARGARPRRVRGRRPPGIGRPPAGPARLRRRPRRSVHGRDPGSPQRAKTGSADRGDRPGSRPATCVRTAIGARLHRTALGWRDLGSDKCSFLRPGRADSEKTMNPSQRSAGRGRKPWLSSTQTFDIAVIVAAIVSFTIGGIWYSRPVFGKVWMAALGKTEADMEAMRKQAPKGVAGGLVGSFIASLVLAILLEYGRLANVGLPGGVAGGLVIGFLVWFGFLMTTTVTGGIFEGTPGQTRRDQRGPHVRDVPDHGPDPGHLDLIPDRGHVSPCETHHESQTVRIELNRSRLSKRALSRCRLS